MPESSPTHERKRPSVRSSDRAKVPQDKAREQFITDMQRMLNEDGCSDVVFICKDGKRVKAIRSLLVGRSHVLKRMLENGMRETFSSEINLSNISSQTLLCVFEFLYTGTILLYQPKTWKLQLKVAVAAQYFLLDNLVDIVLKLMDETSEVTTDLPEVAAMLTVTLELNNSCQEYRSHGIQRKLVRLLSSNWTHSGYAANLSEEALHYLLWITRAENEAVYNDNLMPYKTKEPSLTEYYQFRQIILWWAYQNVPGWSKQAEEMVESAVPVIKDTSNLYFDVDIGDENAGSNPFLRLKSLLTASRGSAMRLLSNIDLRYVQLLLFEKVVKPLECCSSSEIARVLRFHALNEIMRSTNFRNATCGWKHGTSLTASGDGSSIEKTGCDGGTAIASMKMSSKNSIRLWRFVIDRVQVSHVEVGFMFINADRVSGWGESDLNNKTLAELPKAGMLGIFYGHKKPYTFTKHQGERWNSKTYVVRKGSKFVFMYDFVERNCSLSVDGRNRGVCWENLPDLDCYPTVSFGKSKRPRSGLIRIQTPQM